MLQLREKELDDKDFIAEAVQVRQLCRRYGVPLIINDRVDVALKCSADGVHVGIEDAPVAEIRKVVPPGFIIGATAKTVEQALLAQQGGADYLGVGAVFASPTKKTAIRITREQLQRICSAVDIPAVAIGGITCDNAVQLRGSGVQGLAVVSALFAAENICAAGVELKQLAKTVVAG